MGEGANAPHMANLAGEAVCVCACVCVCVSCVSCVSCEYVSCVSVFENVSESCVRVCM